ncbi:hypothetical protein F7R91_14780 [Streptomyces luteolifulvus]|uniref:Uncharacterized protein n=1 Tax=Streptomyces luteolifulvus TaxID=2615112 RepID=A0A6H9V296_9ACTN|nr:hypothetical protein [Streptomyces luteolifulvus]KAB1146838.1 hypothetical protein F7R91_14780 [Streptomyces luteolifulvus]
MTSPVEEQPPPPANPPPPFTTERRDASVTEQWDVPSRTYRRYESGVLVIQRPFTDAENASANQALADGARTVNKATLLLRARTALASNAAYLDKVNAGTATNADHIAQVPALTRQMQGLIRLIVGSDLLDQT